MAYPFPGVTLKSFMDRASADFGVTERYVAQLNGPNGATPVISLERAVNGRTYRVPKPNLEDDEPLDPIMMENLCRRLGLDKAVFGYKLT